MGLDQDQHLDSQIEVHIEVKVIIRWEVGIPFNQGANEDLEEEEEISEVGELTEDSEEEEIELKLINYEYIRKVLN
jgi:hypothetical protein